MMGKIGKAWNDWPGGVLKMKKYVMGQNSRFQISESCWEKKEESLFILVPRIKICANGY